MTVICLMLFFTITLLFIMVGLQGSIDETLAEDAPFDDTAFLVANNESEDPKANDIEDYLNKINFTFEAYEKHAFYREYKLDLTIEDLLSKHLSEQEQIELQEQYLDGAISAIKISDYNDIIRLTGQEAIPLQEDEVLVVSNYGRLNDALDQYMQGESIINIEGEAYTIKNESPIEENIKITGGSRFFYLVISDNFNGNLQLEFASFNVIYEDSHSEASEEKFSTLFNELLEDRYRDVSSALVIGQTMNQVPARVIGLPGNDCICWSVFGTHIPDIQRGSHGIAAVIGCNGQCGTIQIAKENRCH